MVKWKELRRAAAGFAGLERFPPFTPGNGEYDEGEAWAAILCAERCYSVAADMRRKGLDRPEFDAWIAEYVQMCQILTTARRGRMGDYTPVYERTVPEHKRTL